MNIRKTIENIILVILVVALVLAVLGMVLTKDTLAKAAFVILMLVSIAYTVLQVMDYFDTLKLSDAKRRKSSFWFMVLTVVIALAIICVSIFALAGKLTL